MTLAPSSWVFQCYSSFYSTVLSIYTHALKNLHIPAIAYFLNTLDSQRSERGMGGPNYFKVGEHYEKYVPHSMPIFEKKSHPIRSVEGLKLGIIYFTRNELYEKPRPPLLIGFS